MIKKKLVIFIFPMLFLFSAFLINYYNSEVYFRLFGIFETGFFEWIQFLCYGLAFFIGIKAYTLYKKNSQKIIQKYILLFFAIGCAFIALEEISYGQHIFKWETPELIKNINQQGEINFHNLVIMQGNNIQEIAFVLVGYFGGLSWIFLGKTLNYSKTNPVLSEWYLSLYFLPVSIFYTQKIWILHWGNNHQELFETILSFGFLGISLINLRRFKKAIK